MSLRIAGLAILLTFAAGTVEAQPFTGQDVKNAGSTLGHGVKNAGQTVGHGLTEGAHKTGHALGADDKSDQKTAQTNRTTKQSKAKHSKARHSTRHTTGQPPASQPSPH